MRGYSARSATFMALLSLSTNLQGKASNPIEAHCFTMGKGSCHWDRNLCHQDGNAFALWKALFSEP